MNSELLSWAARNCHSPAQALHELHLLLGMDYIGESATDLSSEAAVLQREHLKLCAEGGRSWRNNSGAVDPSNPPTQWLRFGLMNESVQMNSVLKSPDRIGIKPIRITPAHVGTIIGQFWGREGKRPGWRYTGTDREVAQLNGINLINRLGGDARFVNGSDT